MYAKVIIQILDKSQWIQYGLPDIAPPKIRRQPGRPKKLIRRGQGEADNDENESVRKDGVSQSCGH